MLTSEQKAFLQRHISIDGDGNVVGNDNTVRVTKQAADDYAVQIGEQHIAFNIAELRCVLHIEHSQVGVIGDGTTVHGGIHFHEATPSPPPSPPFMVESLQDFVDRPGEFECLIAHLLDRDRDTPARDEPRRIVAITAALRGAGASWPSGWTSARGTT